MATSTAPASVVVWRSSRLTARETSDTFGELLGENEPESNVTAAPDVASAEQLELVFGVAPSAQVEPPANTDAGSEGDWCKW